MTTLGLLLAAGLLTVGCAERQSKTQYEETIQDARKERIQVLNRMKTVSPEDEEFFLESQKRLDGLADDLADVGAPSNVTAAHAAQVEGLHGIADILGEFGRCARLQQQDAAKGTQCRSSINSLAIDEARNDLDEADTIYRDKGYDLGPEKG